MSQYTCSIILFSSNICRKCNLWRHQLHIQHTSDDALHEYNIWN